MNKRNLEAMTTGAKPNHPDRSTPAQDRIKELKAVSDLLMDAIVATSAAHLAVAGTDLSRYTARAMHTLNAALDQAQAIITELENLEQPPIVYNPYKVIQ